MDFASYVHQYYRSGYLFSLPGIRLDYMNKTVPTDAIDGVLKKIRCVQV